MAEQLSHTPLLGPTPGYATHLFGSPPLKLPGGVDVCMLQTIVAGEGKTKEISHRFSNRDMGILFGKLRFLRRKPLWRSDGKNKPHVLQRGVFCSLAFRYTA